MATQSIQLSEICVHFQAKSRVLFFDFGVTSEAEKPPWMCVEGMGQGWSYGVQQWKMASRVAALGVIRIACTRRGLRAGSVLHRSR